MLRLMITPNEFASMIYFMRKIIQSEWYRTLPLQSKPVNVLVMSQYLERWNNYKLVRWLCRPRKLYTLSIPLPLARALHQEMQLVRLSEGEQLFLNTLDQSITNYRDPLGEAHAIGELIHQQRLV